MKLIKATNPVKKEVTATENVRKNGTVERIVNTLIHIYPLYTYLIFFFLQKYNVRIRGRAVEIFSSCVFMICAMSDNNTGVTRTLLNPVLPSFSERFVCGLQVPNGIHSDSCLKANIIKGKHKSCCDLIYVILF
jgi:hypothetical protein